MKLLKFTILLKIIIIIKAWKFTKYYSLKNKIKIITIAWFN